MNYLDIDDLIDCIELHEDAQQALKQTYKPVPAPLMDQLGLTDEQLTTLAGQ